MSSSSGYLKPAGADGMIELQTTQDRAQTARRALLVTPSPTDPDSSHRLLPVARAVDVFFCSRSRRRPCTRPGCHGAAARRAAHLDDAGGVRVVRGPGLAEAIAFRGTVSGDERRRRLVGIRVVRARLLHYGPL